MADKPCQHRTPLCQGGRTAALTGEFPDEGLELCGEPLILPLAGERQQMLQQPAAVAAASAALTDTAARCRYARQPATSRMLCSPPLLRRRGRPVVGQQADFGPDVAAQSGCDLSDCVWPMPRFDHARHGGRLRRFLQAHVWVLASSPTDVPIAAAAAAAAAAAVVAAAVVVAVAIATAKIPIAAADVVYAMRSLGRSMCSLGRGMCSLGRGMLLLVAGHRDLLRKLPVIGVDEPLDERRAIDLADDAQLLPNLACVGQRLSGRTQCEQLSHVPTRGRARNAWRPRAVARLCLCLAHLCLARLCLARLHGLHRFAFSRLADLAGRRHRIETLHHLHDH